jgi:hypothetical protein
VTNAFVARCELSFKFRVAIESKRKKKVPNSDYEVCKANYLIRLFLPISSDPAGVKTQDLKGVRIIAVYFTLLGH